MCINLGKSCRQETTCWTIHGVQTLGRWSEEQWLLAVVQQNIIQRSRSACASKISLELNRACRTITGTLRVTPLSFLYRLAGIPSPEIGRESISKIDRDERLPDNRHPLYGHEPFEVLELSLRETFNCLRGEALMSITAIPCPVGRSSFGEIGFELRSRKPAIVFCGEYSNGPCVSTTSSANVH